MNAQLATLGIGLGLSQVAKRLDLDGHITALRLLYAGVHLLLLGLYLHIAQKVRRKNDTTLVKYVETKPFASQTGEPPSVVTTSVRNYDLLETSKAIRALMTGIAMTLFMHLYMHFTQPLLVSSLTVWISLYRSNIVRLHLRGQEGAEDLKRPFGSGGGFMGSAGPATDKASIEEAERANLLYREKEY